MRILAPMKHLAAFLFVVVSACGGDGDGAAVPLYGGGCVTDEDCEGGAVCRSAGGVPGLCTTECSSRADCVGFADCLPEGVCIEWCLDDAACGEGTVCLRGSDPGTAAGSCYPIPPQ